MGWTRTELTALLRARGLRLRRSLGQNFLVDGNFLQAIVRDAAVEPGDGVIEIGTGAGSLTDRLAAAGARVWSFEIDPAIHALASEMLAGRPDVTLILGDGAEFERQAFDVPRLKVVANLPYEPWKRLLLRLLSTSLPIVSYTLMLQKDVVDRLRAAPGTRDYGPMAAIVQATCEMKVLRKASPALFLPPPRVESAVFQLVRRRREPGLEGAEEALRGLFAGRRKKSTAAGGRRVEELAPEELLNLAIR
jgi:16S rRNA (adenine1518-N6/adenine1519-N6)-dimethyltransferase